MNKIRCVAVDDEPLALALLADNIKKVPYLELVATCEDALETLEVINRETVDLLFMDIQMPGLTGTQFLKSLTQRPQVIFVTAYEQYALEGFNLNVLDYLLKPVPMARFLQATEKAREFFSRTKAAVTTAPAEDHFFVHADYSLVKIQVPTILYIEGLKDYVKIHTTVHSRPVITRMTLKNLEEILPAPAFLRVHRSYIIATDRVDAIRKLKITVAGNSIPVSEQYLPQILEVLQVNKHE
ncbi:LytTR family DNA-binding domain-containing protein [Siphonobacter sp. SORGH_AS_1065]|uniref:LytR/AlgR family response regulator transcription factor n=1 Tax=Siphonobacter sp. SORGH_AS_1065 TaxID=3041795 RepID=UPI002783C919|nr:response regulator [Siphonobacter sp. SORGH_AS_1065]MDQ1088197.1 DNA-binding LytR/AlgR family response regulator [Siphonobacter sp. SORGH_AS_1065]